MGNNLIKSGVVFVDLSCMWKYSGKIKDTILNWPGSSGILFLLCLGYSG